jgi:hypothetical protein
MPEDRNPHASAFAADSHAILGRLDVVSHSQFPHESSQSTRYKQASVPHPEPAEPSFVRPEASEFECRVH